MDNYISGPIEGLLGYRDQDERRDEHLGQQDGKRAGSNASAEDLIRKQDGYIATAGAQVVLTQARLSERIGRLQADADAAESRMSGGLRQQKQGAETKLNVVLTGLEQRLGPTSDLQTRLRDDQRVSQERLDEKRLILRRELRVSLPTFYLPFMALLAIAEVPINRLAFELFFQESPLIAVVLALMAGASLMFFAHVIGTLARHLSFGRDTDTLFRRVVGIVTRIAGIALLTALSLTLIYFIALLRQRFADLLDAEASAPSFGDMLAQGSVGETIREVTQTVLRQTGWGLLILNVVIFGVGLVAAFFRHDPDPDYEKLVQKNRRSSIRLSKVQAAYSKEADRLRQRHHEEIRVVGELVEKTEKERNERLAEIEGMSNDFEGTLRAVAAVVHRQVLAYERGYVAGARLSGLSGNVAFGALTMEETLSALNGYLARGPQ